MCCISKKLKILCKEHKMLEPVQNCFTFYHPDGVSSAHEYSEQEELITSSENKLDATSIVAQQDLALPSPTINKDS